MIPWFCPVTGFFLSRQVSLTATITIAPRTATLTFARWESQKSVIPKISIGCRVASVPAEIMGDGDTMGSQHPEAKNG
jgi:hypothetical protein